MKKLAGKLDVCRQQLRAVQDSLMEQGTTIVQLKQQIAALSLKPSHVIKPHIEPNAGEEQAAGGAKPAMKNPEGDYGDGRTMLTKLPTFAGDPRYRRAFINFFLLRASQCNDAQKRYWFQKLAGLSCFSWFESGSWLSWDEMKTALLDSFTVRYRGSRLSAAGGG